MAGAARASADGLFGVANHLELAASFRNCYAGFMGLTRVPEFNRSDVMSQNLPLYAARLSQRYEVLSMGMQRQVGAADVSLAGKQLGFYPYLLGGFALHSSYLTSRNLDTQASFPETFTWQRAVLSGAGVRFYTPRSDPSRPESLWGIRLEYRAYLPMAARFNFEAHHVFLAGISIRFQRK